MKIDLNKSLAFLAVLIAGAVFFVLPSSAQAAPVTLYASPSDAGTHDCLSLVNSCDLQQALDLANTNNDNATIILSAGTFTAGASPFAFNHVGFTHDLMLVGAGLGSTFITNTNNGLELSYAGALEVS